MNKDQQHKVVSQVLLSERHQEAEVVGGSYNVQFTGVTVKFAAESRI